MATVLKLPQEGIAPAVYQEALGGMQHLYDEIHAGNSIAGVAVFVLVERLLEALVADGKTLLGLTAQMPTSNPMASHAVNTCIMTMATARSLGAPDDKLREVGAAALLHDVGLVKLVDHTEHRDVRYDDIKSHPEQTAEYLGQLPELSRLTLYLSPTQTQSSRDIELRNVIRLADLYEALSHPRAQGTPLAFAAVRTILTAQRLFEPRLVKAFFDQVGIYPLGTWAELSTGEIALVTGIHAGLPLRPEVSVIYDREGHRYLEPRDVQLSEYPMVYIRRSLDREPGPRR